MLRNPPAPRPISATRPSPNKITDVGNGTAVNDATSPETVLLFPPDPNTRRHVCWVSKALMDAGKAVASGKFALPKRLLGPLRFILKKMGIPIIQVAARGLK